jgi:acetyl esterase/lipase
MSIRASLLSFMMKHTIRKQFDQLDDVQALRDVMQDSSRLSGALPDRVAIVPQALGELNMDWVMLDDVDQSRVILYLHGGGYVVGSADGYRDINWRLAEAAGCRVLFVDYRLAPESPFPAAVEDATAAYRWLLDEGFAPENIALCGDSAGGGLSMALLVNLKNLGLPQPGCAMLMSPWVDLSCSGKSITEFDGVDVILTARSLNTMAEKYLGERDRRAPLASPLFAELSGLCPISVHVGSEEVLYSDSENLVEKILAAGGKAELEVWPKMPHVFPVFAARIPEGKVALEKMAEFCRKHTGAAFK